MSPAGDARNWSQKGLGLSAKLSSEGVVVGGPSLCWAQEQNPKRLPTKDGPADAVATVLALQTTACVPQSRDEPPQLDPQSQPEANLLTGWLAGCILNIIGGYLSWKCGIIIPCVTYSRNEEAHILVWTPQHGRHVTVIAKLAQFGA